jgi:hypothetical protein
MPRTTGSRTRRGGAEQSTGPTGRHHSRRAGTGHRIGAELLAATGGERLPEVYVAAGAGRVFGATPAAGRGSGTGSGEPQVITPMIRRAWPAMVFTLLALAAVLLVLVFSGSVATTPTRFAIDVLPTSQPVHVGNAASYQVTVTAHGSYRGQLGLATSSMPVGITAAFSQTSAALTRTARQLSVTVTFTAGPTAEPGPHVIAVTAGDGRSTASADLILQVVSAPSR